MINGVQIKRLIVHKDERGFFSEILRKSDGIFKDGFGQLSFSKAEEGVAKAWHLHKQQTDWIAALSGDMKLVLYDRREQSPTHKEIVEILIGSSHGFKVVKVPPGVAHGYKVISGPAQVLYVTSREYDPADELRIPHDDPEIGYTWDSPYPIK
ncbi:dTDP-4-dehydrorhamnose 3,5-epimerase family protein [Candidatus Omnitrophota bacterium]